MSAIFLTQEESSGIRSEKVDTLRRSGYRSNRNKPITPGQHWRHVGAGARRLAWDAEEGPFMSEHTGISDIFARQRAERDRIREEQVRDQERVAQLQELGDAFLAVRHCVVRTVPTGADFFAEFAAL